MFEIKTNSIMWISAYCILELFQGQDKYLRSLSTTSLIYNESNWSSENVNDLLKICWFIHLANT